MAKRELISNAVENIAFRLCQERGGAITPAEILPYLPVSIEMVIDILNDAAAESKGIEAETLEGLRRYSFDITPGSASQPQGMRGTRCVNCDLEERQEGNPLCTQCAKELEKELRREAETNAWPAKAVYEHEICYLAARMSSPVSAEQLASGSRLTLRRMRRKLEEMQQTLAVREERNPESGVLSYVFPAAPYPRDRFLANLRLIRTFPSSLAEDIEVRTVHILTALGILFIALLGLAFWGIPFPLLLIVFLITAPVLALVIWKRKLKYDTMEVQ